MGDSPNNKKYDPGWNDPPMLNYSSSNPPPKSRIGNKRVAFPLSGQNVSTQASSSLNAIPSILKPTDENVNKQVTLMDSWNSELRLNEVNENISKLLTNKKQSTDIAKRLDVMKEMWSSAQLSEDCQRKVIDIINTLLVKDYSKSEKLQLELVMEFGSQCTSWVIAIRHLIQECKN